MRIYLAQSAIDRAIGTGQVQLEGELLHLAVPGGLVPLAIVPAVYFAQLDEGDDPDRLVGCVKTVAELARMGAEHFETSVIIGERVYSVVPGLLGSPVGPDGTPSVVDPATWPRVQAFLSSL